jgi:uncharacterized membrane protein
MKMIQALAYSFTHCTMGCFVLDTLIIGWIALVVGLVVHTVYNRKQGKQKMKNKIENRVVKRRQLG